MSKQQLDAFAAALTQQLKDAAIQLKEMREPPQHDQKSMRPPGEHLNPSTTSLPKNPQGMQKAVPKHQQDPQISIKKKNQNIEDTETPRGPQIQGTEHKQQLFTTNDTNLQPVTASDTNERLQTIPNTTQSPTPTAYETPIHPQPNINTEYSLPQKDSYSYEEYSNQTNAEGVINCNLQKQPVHDSLHTPTAQKQPVWGEYNPKDLGSTRLATSALHGARQLILDALIQLRNESPQVTINLKRLATVLGLSYGTVRNTISRLVHDGIIYTTQIRTGDLHGVHIEFPEQSPLLQSVTVQQASPPSRPTHKEPPSKTRNPLWDTDINTLMLLWPHATSAGFSPAHLEKLYTAFQIQGFDDTHVAKYIRYLNWSIESASPSASEHVLEQWMTSMIQKGMYPCPQGYSESSI